MSPTKLCLKIRTFTLCGQVLNNKRFSENTKSILIDGLKLTLDIVGLVYTLYFCGVWTVQILRQQPMRVLFTFLYVILTFLAFMDMILFTVMLYADERKNMDQFDQ